MDLPTIGWMHIEFAISILILNNWEIIEYHHDYSSQLCHMKGLRAGGGITEHYL